MPNLHERTGKYFLFETCMPERGTFQAGTECAGRVALHCENTILQTF